MGLVAVAIVAGAGVYVTKKISKSRNKKRNNRATAQLEWPANGSGSRDSQDVCPPYIDPKGSMRGLPAYDDAYPSEKGPSSKSKCKKSSKGRHFLSFTDRRSAPLQHEQEGQRLHLTNDPHSPLPPAHIDSEASPVYQSVSPQQDMGYILDRKN